MASKYVLHSVGKGCRLYLVLLRNDRKLGKVATISGNLGTREAPWQLRWTDFFNTEHIRSFRTKKQCSEYLEAQ